MSFRDLERERDHPPKTGHASKQQPKQRRRDDTQDAFERPIRAAVQELQDAVRKASTQLEQVQKNQNSKRSGEILNQLLANSGRLADEAANLLRDWTVHLAGEPSERHRKKFSHEKLQKAFDEEVVHLKEVNQRASALNTDAPSLIGASAQWPPGSFRECQNVCEGPDIGDANDHADSEAGLLSDAVVCDMGSPMQEESTLRIRSTIVQERDEGIRRIQNQVTEVNQMFRDLASIVHDQGHQFESIERNAESAAVNTKQAVQELKNAVDRQRGNRERLCCMLVAAVCLLVFVMFPHMHAIHTHFGSALVQKRMEVTPPRPDKFMPTPLPFQGKTSNAGI